MREQPGVTGSLLNGPGAFLDPTSESIRLDRKVEQGLLIARTALAAQNDNGNDLELGPLAIEETL